MVGTTGASLRTARSISRSTSASKAAKAASVSSSPSMFSSSMGSVNWDAEEPMPADVEIST